MERKEKILDKNGAAISKVKLSPNKRMPLEFPPATPVDRTLMRGRMWKVAWNDGANDKMYYFRPDLALSS